ncbi:MAG: C10 family peptidase [Prolixibacteraceae bacterium]
MKYITIIVLFIFVSVTTFAKTVELDQIRTYANQFINVQQGNTTIASIEAIKTNGSASYYYVKLQPKGFILLSADDKVEPLLAYSFESEAQLPNDWPDQLSSWMRNSARQIEHQMSDIHLSQHKDWNEEALLKSATATSVSPLIPVRWDQGRRWNQFCPEDEDGPGGNVYVGCVAVSMAQAMSKYKYPTKGQGKSSYEHKTYGALIVNFDKESPYQWDSMSTSSADEYNSRLLYHCAVTVQMDFGADGSGAFTGTAASSLKNYFNYSQSVKSVDRLEDDDEWKALLTQNLKEGYPIIYHGDGDDGEAGHAWNIDGVDNSGLFHVNWGWSGSMNGYFNINNLAPGSNDFTKNQGAILGIKPKQPGPINISLDNTSVREKQPAGTFVANVFVEDEYPDNAHTFNLKGNPIVIGTGYASPKFYIENDSVKTIETFDYDKRQQYILFIEAVDSMGNSFEKKFEINIEQAVGVKTIDESESFSFYPNPFHSIVTLESASDGKLSIFNHSGQLVSVMNITNGTKQIDLSHLEYGLYLLQLKTTKGIFYNRVVRSR